MRFDSSHGWSKLAVYETCRYQFALSYIEKLPQPPNLAFIKGNRIHDGLERFIKGAVIMPKEARPMVIDITKLKRRKAKAELKFAFDQNWRFKGHVFHDNDYIRGKIDALVEEKKTVDIIDFKSGRSRANPGQTRFYGLIALLMLPHIEVARPSLWYVEQNEKEDGAEVHRDMVPALKQDLQVRLDRIDKEREWRPTFGDHCRWCAYGKTKGGPCRFG